MLLCRVREPNSAQTVSSGSNNYNYYECKQCNLTGAILVAEYTLYRVGSEYLEVYQGKMIAQSLVPE